MFKLLKTVFKAGDVTTKYPFKPYEVDDDFRGKPELNSDQCIVCAACTIACPANALTMRTDPVTGERTWSLFLGRCIFCGRCEEILLSIMADKDVDEMLALLLPLAKRFVTVAAHTPRAMPAETLAEHIRARGGKAEAAADIPAGVARAVELGDDGPVCALGTLYFSGDVRQAFARLTAE